MYAPIFKRCLAIMYRRLDSSPKRGLKTMRAWQTFEYGGPDNLQLNEKCEIPVIKSCTDILVKVHASSINPLDVRMLEGYGAAAFNFVRKVNQCSLNSEEFPLVLGRDFSGTVVHVGKSVKSIKCGDEIWGALSPWQNGSHSEYVLASVCYSSKKPNLLNHTEAAAFPYAALTAWSALSTFGELSERSAYGKRVLVIGASGGVGTFAIQLLKAWGADVTATCGTDAVELVQSLGADTVLDYHSPEFKYNLKELKGFDLIFDNVGGEYPDLTLDLLKRWRNSKYVTVVSPLLKNADDRGVLLGTAMSVAQAGFDTAMSLKDGRSLRWAYFVPNGCTLNTIARMVDSKKISPVIEKVFKFEEMPQAYEKVLNGHARGKTVVDFEKSEIVIEQQKESVKV